MSQVCPERAVSPCKCIPRKKVHNIFYEARVHPVHSELPREHCEEVTGLNSKNIWSYKLLHIIYFIFLAYTLIFTSLDECINILHFYIFNYNGRS